MVELVIEGDLGGACQTWFEAEQMYRRRRVAFTSYRANDTVTAIVLAPRSATHSLYISCLASPDHRRHYFVGTDALNALEVMLGVSLSDDQKKALRNKFERHGSVTIRKDHDADNLFSLIEGNNDIKPRNLHKGVRIYHWDRLGTFLKDLASKVPAELLPAVLPCSSAPNVAMSHHDQGQQGFVTTAPSIQFDQYGNPLTPTTQQISYLQSSPGTYGSDPYAMQAYPSDQAYIVPPGYSSPTFAPYTMPSPPVMMNLVTAPTAYNVNYAQPTMPAGLWDVHGIRYSQ